MQEYGFIYQAKADAKILILGSMPGVISLKKAEYYAHPRNAFWPIMENITQISPSSSYSARLVGLQKVRIALWDVVASCQRKGSLDSNIQTKTIQINPFKQFFIDHPDIQRVGLNGQKAFQLFERHVVKKGLLPKTIQYQLLPSTSPAYASKTFSQKNQAWLKYLNSV